MQVGVKTDLGRVRKVNEDNYLILERDNWELYAVADGMGGHQAGEVASSLAIEALKEYFSVRDLLDLEENWGRYWKEAFQEANSKILLFGQKNTEQMGMGTTLTGVIHQKGKLYLGHVGDCRLYLIRGEEIRKITDDHSLVEELVRRGEVGLEEAKFHPQRNILLRALGSSSQMEVDLYQEDFAFQDSLLLATDGLTNLVEEKEIQESVSSWPPEQAVEMLTKLANQRGGHDNITTIIVKNLP